MIVKYNYQLHLIYMYNISEIKFKNISILFMLIIIKSYIFFISIKIIIIINKKVKFYNPLQLNATYPQYLYLYHKTRSYSNKNT